MKNKSFLFKVLAIVAGVGSIIFGFLTKFNVRTTAGSKDVFGKGWQLFGDIPKVDEATFALNGVEYNATWRMIAGFALIALAISVVCFAVMVVLSLMAKKKNNTTEKIGKIFSVLVAVFGIVFMVCLFIYTGVNSNTTALTEVSAVMSNIVMPIIATVFAVLTTVLSMLAKAPAKKKK